MPETYGEYQEEYERFVDELRFAGTYILVRKDSGIDWRGLTSLGHGQIVFYNTIDDIIIKRRLS